MSAPRLRILTVLVGVSARAGGTAAFVGESTQALTRLGQEVTVLSPDIALAPGGWAQRQRRVTDAERHPSLSGEEVRVFATRFPRRLAVSPGLWRAAHERARCSDVVHVHNLWQFPQYAGARAAGAAGVPYVVSTHGALDPYVRDHGRLRKRISMALYQDRLLRRAALIHVTTESEADFISGVAPEVPRAVVPCGVDVTQFQTLPAPAQFRREHLDSYDGPLVLFLGRITYKKGLDVLIRAFARARRAGPCRLVLAGPDDEGRVPELKRLVAELRLEHDVAFTGPLYGPARLGALASADVWALSSHAENFGIAVIEALAAGCAVLVSSRVSVAGELARAGAGVIAEPCPEAFGEALAGLLQDGSRRALLAGRGRSLAARYDWSVVGPQLLEMYRRALAQSP
jgi:glycosyltransferase involved in cell wall biosynthesis